jgi:hypothetical protein
MMMMVMTVREQMRRKVGIGCVGKWLYVKASGLFGTLVSSIVLSCIRRIT